MSFLDVIGFAMEKVLAGAVPMPGEELRIAVAFIGLVAASYYDIFNRRIVPDRLLYAFFLVSVAVNLVFFDASLVLYTLVIALFLFVFGYGMYVLGQMGGADVLAMLALVLLLPIHPSFVPVYPNYPFILSVFVFAITLFTLYTLIHFIPKLIQQRAQADSRYFLLFLPFGAVLYLLLNLPIGVPLSSMYLLLFSIAMIGSIFYWAYKTPVLRLLSRELPLQEVEEDDLLALEFMDPKLVWKYNLRRLANKEEIDRLRQLRIARVWVFTGLPPFLPFLLLGFIFALFFSPMLIS